MASIPTQRVIVFIDAQNFYKGARDSFFLPVESAFHTMGQFHPMALGRLLCERAPEGYTRMLEQVRVYTGRPDSSKQSKTYSAHMKQCAAWRKAGTHIEWRMLRYPRDWPKSRAEEKGVDVALAIDYIALALDGAYDVGIIASTDTDLLPAVEFVYRRRYPAQRAEVATWTSATSRKRLSIPGAQLWCHWLTRHDYDTIADLTDYNVQSEPPPK